MGPSGSTAADLSGNPIRLGFLSVPRRVVWAKTRMVDDGVVADRDWNPGDVCRASRFIGGLYLYDDPGIDADAGISRGGDAGGVVVSAVVLLGESSREEVDELDTGCGIRHRGRAALACAGCTEAVSCTNLQSISSRF